ncbi:peroxisomal ATPase PEX1 [Battus philenor]|uniref:peroxisomal ATPase PEX1 n=1 Tax=Battus philenor TaxID=42288 RepID=UPI0035D10897
MIGGVRLKVSYTHERTCFAYISPKYSTNNQQTQCVQVLVKEKQIFLWVVYNSNIPEGYIACNPIYCRLVGLDESSEVFVTPNNDLKVLDELYIDTESPDDQEILEDNAEALQLKILDQLRLVVANQKAIVWISTSMPIIFTPKQTGIIVNHSRVVVKVDAFNTHRSNPYPINLPKDTDTKFNNIGIINNALLQPYLNAPKKLVLRALPIDSDGKRNLIHPYIVFVHEDLVHSKYKELTVILATMEHIPSIIKDSNDENDASDNEIDGICVEIVPIDNVVFRSLSHEVYNSTIPTVLIPKALNAIINIENGVKIIFNIIGDKVQHPDHIDIVTYSIKTQTEVDVIERFKKCVVENTHSGKKFLINHNMIKQNTQISSGFLQFKLKPDSVRYTMLNSESFRQCTVAAKCLADSDLTLPKPVVSHLEYDYRNYCRNMKSVQNLVEKIILDLQFEIHREASFKGVSEIKSNVLVTGLSGTGKSSLCHIVQKDLTVWSHILHCRSLKGRKDIPEVLGKAILMCQEHSPAVLICDDLDALVPSNIEGASPQDIAYYQRLAVVIKHLLQTCAGVCVLMTSLTMKSLHPILRQFNGKPLFTAHFDIPELDQEERVEMFKHLLNDKIRSSFEVNDDDIIKMAMDTAGGTVRDVCDYLNKRIFKAVKRKKSKPDEKPRLVDEVQKDEERTNAFDIWGPVGGMAEVKQVLTESIFWPIMYPALFPTQSCGILLYGMPGTGKSHVGSCLARLANMHLITVKGPELLSKYIGQSEKAIRDIFDKAEMKRPCILFFDEFDSLAPKRGHDSTGVTDRVVNQLLARMDGAEGGARGAVLAATSRPDLVDPALLRPGRLQRHVYCPPPTKDDRYEILQTLAEDVAIDAQVDLQDLAARTEDFSPADLKSLLITAQLGRLEQQLVKGEEKNMESVIVYQEDLEIALKETKPSLSKEQRLFYDTVYRRFRGESLSSEHRQLSKEMQKQRVTLA